jgi:Rrf2 family transcriptional regulator, cysteine metabolism repressor
MKLSTRSRYGLRAIVELAARHGSGTTSMQEIAQAQQVSRKYLDTLFYSMKMAGLVVSRRGLGGGWELTRAPASITAVEVLEALEGSLSLVQCVEFPDTCAKTPSCVTRELFAELDEAIRKVLGRRTLADLVARREELDALAPAEAAGDDGCAAAPAAE